MGSHQHLPQDVLRLIEAAKKLGVDQAEIAVSLETGYSVTARCGAVETLEHHQEKDLQITVYKDQRTGSTSTSDLSPEATLAALKKACAIAQYTEADPCAGLAEAQLMAKHCPDLQLYHPWSLTPTAAIEMTIHCESLAQQQDARIKNSEGASVSTLNAYYLYANSNGFLGEVSASEHSLSCSLIAQAKGEMQRDYEYTIARDPNQLWSIETVAKMAAEKTVKRLGARKIKTQRAPVIFQSNVAKSLINHFVAAISGYNLYRRTTFLLDHLEKPVFPVWMNIQQDPYLLGAMGSAAFDDDGVATKKIQYIKDGVLTSYVLGNYSARQLGLITTGNAGGVFNLMVTPHDKSFQQLLSDMNTGLLVTELIGQGVNLMTGDYSRGAVGFWVENGEIQYPVEEITIAGNLRDLFQNIQCISNDVDTRGNIRTGSILLDQMTIAGN